MVLRPLLAECGTGQSRRPCPNPRPVLAGGNEARDHSGVCGDAGTSLTGRFCGRGMAYVLSLATNVLRGIPSIFAAWVWLPAQADSAATMRARSAAFASPSCRESFAASAALLSATQLVTIATFRRRSIRRA